MPVKRLVATLLVLAAPAALAQESGLDFRKVERVLLDDVHPGGATGSEEVVDLYLRALSRASAPVKGLRAADLAVFEDGQRVEPSEVAVQPLSATGHGVALVLAIDTSGTMRGEPFERAKEGAQSVLERLRPQDKVAIVAFAEDVRVVSDFDQLRPEARAALRHLEIDPEKSQRTVLYDGAYRAVELLRTAPGLPRRRVVALLSDGKDGGSHRAREELLASAKGDLVQPAVSFYSIGYARFGSEGLEEMRRIAGETGGDYLEATSAGHVTDFYDAVATQILSSYVVRFATDLDGARHEVKVQIEQQSAMRAAQYPDVGGPLWPWLVGLAALLALGAAVFLVLRARRLGELRVKSGALAGQRFELRGSKLTIGAQEGNDIVLATPFVSSHHAEVLIRGKRVELRDLRSKNGTRVNGKAVSAAPLEPGDRIEVADVELVYER
jgi:VWFA-related protein